jgi:hypothetical protein
VITVLPLNNPYDTIQLGDGRIGAFCFIQFNSTAVGGIAGTTYDPTNHLTTSFPNGGVAPGFSPFDYWGMKEIEQIEFSGDSSDQQASVGGAAVGRVIPFFFQPGQSIFLFGVGGTGADPITIISATELDTTANALNALTFYCLIIGKGTPQALGVGRKAAL